MKKGSSKIIALIVAALSILALVNILVLGGFTSSPDVDGYTMLITTSAYDIDVDGFDRDAVHDVLSDLINVPFTVGITRNYSHNYPDIIITASSLITVDKDAVISSLNSAFPELQLEAVDQFDFTTSHTRSEYYLLALEFLVAAVVAFAAFLLIKKYPVSSVVRSLLTVIASVLIASLVARVAGCSEGKPVVLITAISVVTSIVTVWECGNSTKKQTGTALIAVCLSLIVLFAVGLLVPSFNAASHILLIAVSFVAGSVVPFVLSPVLL